ncbi:helix-turn-helix domain-containing protein [Microbispora sp. H10885]|uniref:helix-turn-helix domain-containing protein n=1 Tax=Microbispora sp. H10885 TaxID=2729110 RepID=UPI002175A0C6|nr:helix-turn-helix domain-containing protein [Microbispora sp. H10885]
MHQALDTTTPGGRLVFHVFAGLAEFIRELIVQGTQEGLAAARARGQRLGRPPAMDAEMVARARRLLAQPEETASSIAKLLGVSRAMLYRYVSELQPEWRRCSCGSDPVPAVPHALRRAGAHEAGYPECGIMDG